MFIFFIFYSNSNKRLNHSWWYARYGVNCDGLLDTFHIQCQILRPKQLRQNEIPSRSFFANIFRVHLHWKILTARLYKIGLIWCLSEQFYRICSEDNERMIEINKNVFSECYLKIWNGFKNTTVNLSFPHRFLMRNIIETRYLSLKAPLIALNLLWFHR